jgi:hypothetical protein
MKIEPTASPEKLVHIYRTTRRQKSEGNIHSTHEDITQQRRSFYSWHLSAHVWLCMQYVPYVSLGAHIKHAITSAVEKYQAALWNPKSQNLNEIRYKW